MKRKKVERLSPEEAKKIREAKPVVEAGTRDPIPASRFLGFTSPESELIQSVDYYPSSEILVITFKGGLEQPKKFRYINFPAKLFCLFSIAESKGAFFMKEIRPKFEGERQQ